MYLGDLTNQYIKNHFIIFHDFIVSHFVNLPHFIQPVSYWWIFRWFPIFHFYKQSYNEETKKRTLYESMIISVVSILKGRIAIQSQVYLKFVKYYQIIFHGGGNVWKFFKLGFLTSTAKPFFFGFPNLSWTSRKGSDGDNGIITQTEISVWCSLAQPFPATVMSLQICQLYWLCIPHGMGAVA